ncbi:acetylserotonin O-methyltransferase-like [Montipora capricornis]|uniref:acetylserotonin O-methyltransferase-like n=1 Tax=Montipora capricornis TaxID=246305 RepID=UPI0035F0FC2B
MASQFLTESSPDSITGFTDHSQKRVYPLFGNLETAVKEGTDQWMNTFSLPLEDMWENGFTKTDEQVSPLLCDLGGNSGYMAYTLCQYYPDMKITVCDFQSVVDSAPHFKPSLEDCPNQANVSFVAGDFFKPNLPKADLYVLSRVIHDWPDDKVDIILSNVYNCLPSGGGLLVVELTLDDDKTGPLKALLQSLLVLVIAKGKERSGKEYKELLGKHGFVDVQIKRLDSKSWMDAIFCRKG